MSEKSLDQLITSLKTEAIEAAEKQAEKILADARAEAERIVSESEKKREQLLSQAEHKAQVIRDKGEAALRQAGRDYSISLRNELLHIFQTTLESETRKEFTPDLMKTAIIKVIENIDGETILELSPEFSEELADYIHDRLKSSEKTVTIIRDNNVLRGFSVSNKNQGWSYTISPEEVAEALNNYLNKNWVNILKGGA